MNIRDYISRTPSEFIEDFYGIKLLSCQKFMVNNVDNVQSYFVQSRIYNRKWLTYLSLLNHFVHMKETDTIGILKPDGYEVMTRDEFAEYINKFY